MAAETRLSLWLEPQAVEEAARQRRDARLAPPRLELQGLDAEGEAVGEPVELALPPARALEIPTGRAGFERIGVRPPLSLPADALPAETARARVRSDGRILAEADIAQFRFAPPGTPERRHFNPGGSWTILLVAERFGDAERFFERCRQLRDFMSSAGPFSDPAVGAQLHLEALYWPSPPQGLFNTRVDGRLVYGDETLVEAYVEASGSSGRMTVVLVDLETRGGAGGMPDRPAWVSTTSEAWERWEAVALHELGHSFGLADEYDDAAQPVPEPFPLEPNVTAERDCAHAPWSQLRTPGFAHDPTSNAAGQPAVPPDTIGTFEGARYEKYGRYRPMASCLMRGTDQPFCRICQLHIANLLLPPP